MTRVIAIALTGWALLGSTVVGLLATEIWIRLRGVARSRRHPAAGPTARDLAALVAPPPGQGAVSGPGALILNPAVAAALSGAALSDASRHDLPTRSDAEIPVPRMRVSP